MRTDKLKDMLKKHFYDDDHNKGIDWEQFDSLKDAIDECLEGGGDVHVRYTVAGPEVQLTYTKKTPPQY